MVYPAIATSNPATHLPAECRSPRQRRVPCITRQPSGTVVGYQPFHLLVVDDLAAPGPIAFWDLVDQRPDMKRPWAPRLDPRRGADRGVHIGGKLLFTVLR